jgi:hypothetical protein
VLWILGSVLLVAGVGLLLARRWVIRNVTSRSLGSLAAGYAATDRGFVIYALLVIDLGWLVVAIASGWVWLVVAAIVVFVIASIAVIAGEVVTYRALKRPR